MPRVAHRAEPSESPTRTPRQGRNKREQILRTLDKASLTSGTQFAVILVGAKGEVETHASNAFQPFVSMWFNDTVQRTASQVVLEYPQERGIPQPNLDSIPVEIDYGALAMPGVLGGNLMIDNTGYVPSETKAAWLQHEINLAGNVIADAHDPGFLALLPPYSDQLYFPKFLLLQQRTCKIIVRCWVKAVEPKKHTRFPYQGGEDTKPDWWPLNLLHREPDHLLKKSELSPP